jgi:hypothetical protein
MKIKRGEREDVVCSGLKKLQVLFFIGIKFYELICQINFNLKLEEC